MREPILSETAEQNRPRKPAPPLLDKLATPQKNTLWSFHFGRAGFLFLPMKKSIFLWCPAFQVFRQVAGLASF